MRLVCCGTSLSSSGVTCPSRACKVPRLLAAGAFAVAWNAFVAFWTVSAIASGGVLIALFSLPFWFAGALLIHFLLEAVIVMYTRAFMLYNGT